MVYTAYPNLYLWLHHRITQKLKQKSKQLLLHDKHQIQKKYLGLLIKGTNILSLKPHSETAPTPIDRVTLRLAREMYTHAQERNGYCLPSIYMIS